MSDILSLQTPYVDGDTVTSTNLNDLVKKATFTSAVVDGATTQLSSGAIIVRDGGITEQKLSTATQAKLLQGEELATEAGGNLALVGGDKTGNIRGSNSVDIQSGRSNADEVASGDEAVAIGLESKASGDSTLALGYTASATGDQSTAVGQTTIASGQDSLAVGSDCAATGLQSVSVGYINSASASKAMAFGQYVQVSSANSLELGYWTSSTVRVSGVRLNDNGGVSMTIPDESSAPVDQATAGAEAAEQLGRGMMTITRNNDDITLYVNLDGVIKSLELGTVT